jgi:DNA-directed RNA polymerase specialized sigma24 family protein
MFVMKHQEGLTCEEIADYFGTSVGTVKKTLFRVVEKLREEFRTPEIRLSEGNNARLPEIP